MTETNADTMISLQSGTEPGASVEVSRTVASTMSTFVKDALDGIEDDEAPISVTVPRANGRTLEKVVEFMEYYTNNPFDDFVTPIHSTNWEELVSDEWYRNFLPMAENDDELFDLLTIANFMEIRPLLDLACLKVTMQIVGKDHTEIQTFLSLPSLSPEELVNARAENPWLFDDSVPGENEN